MAKDLEQIMDFFYKESKIQFFNEEVDKENTKKAYIRIFNRVKPFEKEKKKDLFDFNLEELNEFLAALRPSTQSSARTSGRLVTRYIRWAIDSNRSIHQTNPLQIEQAYFNQFVVEEKYDYSLFLTFDEIVYYTEMYFVNPSDAMIVRLLFEGVQGKEGSEIYNLTMDDVNEETGELTLRDDNPKKKENGEDIRILKLYPETKESVLRLLRLADEEKIYIKKNGEMDFDPRIKEEMELEPSKYILKNAKTNTLYSDHATKYTIYNRLKAIRKFKQVQDVKYQISQKNIVKSGQIYLAKKLYERDGELELAQLREIANHFGTKLYWSMREYLNIETVKSVYPDLQYRSQKISNC